MPHRARESFASLLQRTWLVFSGQSNSDEMAHTLLAGADGYLTKPFSMVQLIGQVKASLRLKDAQRSL